MLQVVSNYLLLVSPELHQMAINHFKVALYQLSTSSFAKTVSFFTKIHFSSSPL